MAHESAPATAHELATLFPAPTEVVVAGRIVAIPPCTWTIAGNLLSIGLPIYAALPEGAAVFSILDSHPKETAALLTIAFAVERDWVDGLDVADRARLVAAWVRANGAFFAGRLMPAWLELHQAVAVVLGAGSTSSSPSAPAASPSREASPSKRQGKFLRPSGAAKPGPAASA